MKANQNRRSEAQKREVNPLFVQSLEKGFAVLDAVAQSPQPASLADLMSRTGLGKSAAQRFSHTLTALGYLHKDTATRRYCLSTRALDYTFAYLKASPLIAAAVPHLVDASELCHETINLVVPDGLDIVYIFRIPVRRTMLVATLVGRRRPIHCTSGGRAMLSCLEDGEIAAVLAACPVQQLTSKTITDRDSNQILIKRARIDGYSVAVEEAMFGEIGISAPVVNMAGRPVAAVQSSVSTTNWTEKRVRSELAPLILQTARLISTPLAQIQVAWPPDDLLKISR
jgi:DNA-binding IclR family transcriptional regulator